MTVLRPPNRLRAALLLTALIASNGCIPPPQDISNEPRIRESGVIGSELRLPEDLSLVELAKPYPRLALVNGEIQKSQGGPGRTLGVVTAGIRLRVIKVQRAVYYDDGLFTAQGDLTFAQIQDGPFIGKVVDITLVPTAPPIRP